MIQNSDSGARHRSLALSLVLLSLCACGGGSGGGSTSAATTDFLIHDAPMDDLSSFTATLTDLRLVDPGGAPSSNLLQGPVPLEFLGLQQSSAWLASIAPPAGTWSGVEVVFANGSAAARASSGALVPVTMTSNVLAATFPSDVVLTSGYQRVVIDLDLGSSLTGDVALPPIGFDPSGSASTSSGSSNLPIDEIKGVVDSVAAASSTFSIDAFVDGDQNVALGNVDVRVTGQTMLLMENGALFGSTSAFFSSLVPGQTLVEVHGDLLSGSVTATRIEIEDQAGGAGTANVVEIEGRIVDLDVPGATFELLIQEVEKGAAIAGGVLGSLGNPSTITVSWDPLTVFLQDDTGQLLSSNALAVGLEVDVEFPTFAAEPFPARVVEIEDLEIEFEGFVHDTTGLPSSMIVRLKASDPAILSGQVASTSIDVLVDTTASTFALDVEGEPGLAPDAIQVGLRLDVYGDISGSPTMPTIAATHVEIEPGRFRGDVMTVNPGLSFFRAGVDSIDDPFGVNVVGGPLDVLIDSGARFEGDASSQQQFFALFAGLSGGETLEVEVEGIGTDNAGEVLAFEIDVRVE